MMSPSLKKLYEECERQSQEKSDGEQVISVKVLMILISGLLLLFVFLCFFLIGVLMLY